MLLLLSEEETWLRDDQMTSPMGAFGSICCQLILKLKFIVYR